MPGRAKVEGVGEAKVDLPLSLPPLESVGKSAFTFVRSRRVLVGIVIVTAFRPQLIRAPSSFDRLLNRVSLHNRLEALAWLCQADTTLCCVKWVCFYAMTLGRKRSFGCGRDQTKSHKAIRSTLPQAAGIVLLSETKARLFCQQFSEIASRSQPREFREGSHAQHFRARRV